MADQKVHHEQSVECFNGVWGLLDKSERTAEEDRLMRQMAHASLYHWLQRDDVTAQNISVGLWQVSRVHAVLGDAEAATVYAGQCIELSEREELPAFYRAFGYEAAARAAKADGDEAGKAEFLEKARALLPEIKDGEEWGILEADLEGLAK